MKEGSYGCHRPTTKEETMARIMVDYSVWLGVEVDTDTGEVIRVGHADDIQAQLPDQFYNERYGQNDNTLPEILEPDSPEARKAMEIVERLDVFDGDVRWKYRA
jgi:hypothetical protein